MTGARRLQECLMVQTERQQRGQSAEQTAARFLEGKGMQLIMQNYRCSFGEIDLIMRDRDDIVFVEVRSRSRTDYGHPAETINQGKQRKLIKTAMHFLQRKGWLNKVCSRFDVIAIEFAHDKPTLEWIKNAFWQTSW